MALYAIGDLHLSQDGKKTMDIFEGWENYTFRLVEGFKAISPDDVCVLCGDISWGMNLDGAAEDFLLVNSFPGKKVILKGNHDYWWTTMAKMMSFLEKQNIKNIDFLHNNCFFYGDGIAICGTRGWFYEEEKGDEFDKKILSRELLRLETSLQKAGDKEKFVFLHYPPIYRDYRCDEIISLFEKYSVSLCVYGHIHANGIKHAFEGAYNGTSYLLVSADYMNFTPRRIL